MKKIKIQLSNEQLTKICSLLAQYDVTRFGGPKEDEVIMLKGLLAKSAKKFLGKLPTTEKKINVSLSPAEAVPVRKVLKDFLQNAPPPTSWAYNMFEQIDTVL